MSAGPPVLATSPRASIGPRLTARVLVAVAAIGLLLGSLVGITGQGPAPAAASTLQPCDGSYATGGLTVTSGHGQVLYIDSGAGLDAGYAGYSIASTTARTDIWVQLDAFTGGVIELTNPLDARQQIAKINANGSETAFFLLRAASPTQTPQQHRVRVFDRDPRLTGVQTLYECGYTFTQVRETIKAAANKVCQVTADTAALTLGGTVSLTVFGRTGTIGSGSTPDGKILWFSPASSSAWPTRALRLEQTTVQFGDFVNPACKLLAKADPVGDPLVDTLFLRGDAVNFSSNEYKATYTFRVVGRSSDSVSPKPIAQISSGTQVKHTDLASIPTVTLATNTTSSNLALDKTVVSLDGLSEVVENDDTYLRVPYRITVSTTSTTAVSVDTIVDEAVDSMIWEGNTVSVTDSLGSRTLTVGEAAGSTSAGIERFINGPFEVTSTTPAILTYNMLVPLTDGTYTNSAYALSGETKVGASASVAPRTTVSVSAGGVTTTNDTVALTPEISTQAASSVTTSGAQLNAVVNAQRQSTSVDFEYGTSPTLASATATPLAGTISSSSPTSMSSVITGLAEGTTYYYRARATSGGVTYTGAILSFTTGQTQAPPTAETTAPTNVTTSTATLNGLVDPNLTATTVRFDYRLQGASSWSTSGTIQDLDDDGKSLGAMTLSGSFPTPVSFNMPGVSGGNTYEFKIVAQTSAGNIEGAPVSFRAGAAQSITFAAVSSQVLTTSSLQVDPTASSNLAVTLRSETPAVCSAQKDADTATTWTVALLTTGTCILTSEQDGNATFASADPVTRVFTITAPIAINAATPPGATINVAFGPLNLSAQGGTGSYTAWNIIGGSLPAGLSLNATTGVISGTPTGDGSSTFTVQVTDSGGATAIRKFTIVVAAAVSITAASLPAGVADSSYAAQTLAASGGSGSYVNWAVTVGALPPGLTLASGTGVIDGTPTSAGSYTATVQVTDSQGRTATREFTITVSGPLVIVTGSPLEPAIEDVSYAKTIAAGGGTAPFSSWRVTSGALPPGISINSATGVISGTPTTDGTYTFGISVDDSASATALKEFQLVVQAQATVETLGSSVAPGGKIRLKGKVNPKGVITDTYFEYSTDEFNTTSSTAVVSATGSTDTAVDIDLPGLELDTDYQYRMKASNNRGNRTGSPGSFRTPARPLAAIGADDILIVTETSARIRGKVNAKRGVGPARVRWEPKIAPTVFATATHPVSSSLRIASTDPCVGDATVDGETDESLTCDATGLEPSTTYVVTVSVDNGFATDTATHEFTTLTPANPALEITTTSPLAGGEVSAPYATVTFTASGGSGTYSAWSVTAGALPTGLSLADNGQLTGTPSVAGVFTFTVRVTDSENVTVDKVFSLTVSAAPAPSPPAPPAPSPPEPPAPDPTDEPITQVVSLTAIADQPLSPIPVMASVSSNSPDADIVITSKSPAVCSVSGTFIQMNTTGKCVVEATSDAHGNYTVSAPVSRSFMIVTSSMEARESSTNVAQMKTEVGSPVLIPIPPSTPISVIGIPSSLPNVESVTIRDGVIRIVTKARWTGSMVIPIVVTDDESSLAVKVRVRVGPQTILRGIYQPVSGQQTLVRWPAAKHRGAQYVISVNGRTVCRTSAPQCTVNRLIGPNTRVEVISLGGDRTRSAVAEMRYAPRKPVLATVIYFGFDSSALNRTSRKSLNALARVITREGFDFIRVKGHTDGVGSQQYNVALSQRRINAAVGYLSVKLKDMDIDERALGKLVAAASNATAEGRALNRRVEFLVR